MSLVGIVLLAIETLNLWIKQDSADRRLDAMTGVIDSSSRALESAASLMRMFMSVGGCGPVPDGTMRIFED